MLSSGPILVANGMQFCLLILFDTLLDILLLLFELELLAVIFEVVRHVVHQGLNPFATILSLSLPLLLLFKSHSHVELNLLDLFLLAQLLLEHPILLLLHIVLDDLHCSLALFGLRIQLLVFFDFDLGCKLGDTTALFLFALFSILFSPSLDLCEHLITLILSNRRFLHQNLLLLAFNI